MFWVAQAISLFGDRLNNFSLVALINRFAERPSLALSGLYLAMYLPTFTLTPLIGVLVDRLSKRWVLVVTDLARGGVVILMPVLFAKTGSFLPVMALTFLLSTGNLFFLPAKSGLIPELVEPDRLVRVNAMLWAAGIGGVTGGFLLGGIIFDYLSWSACFYIDGATYIVSALLLLGIAMQGRGTGKLPRPSQRVSFAASVREGFTGLKRHPALRRPFGIQAFVFFGAGGFSVLAIHFIREASPPGSSLGVSTVGLALGLGMGISSYLTHRTPRGRRLAFEYTACALLALGALIIAIGNRLSVIAVGSLVLGLAASPLVIFSEAELQELIPPELRGRIFSLREIMTRSLFLLAAFSFSVLGDVFPRNALLAALGIVLASAGLAWIRLTRHLASWQP
jgi:MFS family permease